MWLVALFAVGIFLTSVFLVKQIIKFCNRFALYDSVNARKIHSGNIPRLGGIAILLAFILGCIAFFGITEPHKIIQKLPFFISCLIIFAVGILDDLVELRARTKLLAQLVATGIAVFFGYRFQSILGIPLNTTVFGRIFSCIFTYCWVIGIINSYNLIDGLDALCGSLALFVLVSVAVIYAEINAEKAITCIFLASAILGFLVFNRPPAKIFMGDNGSQFLGFMVAILPLYVSQNPNSTFEFNKILFVIVFAAIPMTDTIAAIWRRLRERRPIMSPDKRHLHHKLLNLGFSKTQVLILLDLIQVSICAIAILSAKLDKSIATIVLSFTYALVLVFFSVIHFKNLKIDFIDKTRQDKTRQDKTRQDKTRQDKTRQDKTRQDKTRQDKTRQDKTRIFQKFPCIATTPLQTTTR